MLISGFSFQVSAFDFSFRFRLSELCSKYWNYLSASALLCGLAQGCFIFLVEYSWNFSLDILRTFAWDLWLMIFRLQVLDVSCWIFTFRFHILNSGFFSGFVFRFGLKVQISGFRFRISYFIFRISDFGFRISYFVVQFPYVGL